MPVYRSPQGEIIEEKTVKDRKEGEEERDSKTERAAGMPDVPASDSGSPSSTYDKKTRKISRSSDARGDSSAPAVSDDPKTRIMGRDKRDNEAASKQSDPMDDPVVGWLVVIDGHGRGHTLAIGYGSNSIGRSTTERLQIDFGDGQISRVNHATLTFDPKGRKYFVQHGGGKNLTYLEGEPVLSPVQLNPRDKILIGETTLMFVPLCDDQFDWSKSDNADD